MHIIGLTYDRPANAEYRVELPLRQLALAGHRTETISCGPQEVPGLLERLRQADVVHVWRLHQQPVRRTLQALRDAGVAIVWDNDDEMVRLPPGKSRRGQYSVDTNALSRDLAAVMRLADLVTTTSGELARRFRRMGAGEVSVIDNHVATGSMRRPRAPRERVVVGWIAGNEHRADLKQLRIRQALERVLARYDHVDALSFGLDLGVRSERYRRHPAVVFADLPLAIAELDVGIAPIADLSFNRGRSGIKLKEYAACGVPWLASPVGPYRAYGEEQGGRLVPDALWEQRIEELVVDAEARSRLGRAGAEWAATQTIEAHAHCWEDAFRLALQRAAARGGRPARDDVAPARPSPVAVADRGSAPAGERAPATLVARRRSVLGRWSRRGRSA